MTAQLGPGVRVYCGYAASSQRFDFGGASRAGVCTTGTIKRGPFSRDEMPLMIQPDGTVSRMAETWWIVRTDGGFLGAYAESLLTPIDGGDPVRVEREEGVSA
jgi:hypothetical protein